MKPISDPIEWSHSAEMLLIAAERLARTIPGPLIPRSSWFDEKGEIRLPIDPSVFNDLQTSLAMIRISTMLAGLAAENALKGMIWLKGESPPGNHDLIAMCNKTGVHRLLLVDYRADILDALLIRMKTAVRWSARYPHPPKEPETSATAGNDHISTPALARKIIDELDRRILESAPASSPQPKQGDPTEGLSAGSGSVGKP